jgi:N-acetylglucosaminyldiphosphoundecaprenol N-acetyl-beta-D-mannosaminyltransferase
LSGRFDRAAREPRLDRAEVLGCRIDRVDMAEALRRCQAYIAGQSGPHQHMAVNAAKIVSSRSDDDLQRLINGCDLVTADGQAVVWASRLLGDPLPARVTGVDLMEQLLALADRHAYRVFILGARPHTLSLAVARVRARYPRLMIAGYRDGYFSGADEPRVVAQIRAARPDLLFVAMPTPRKEYFLARWGSRLDIPFAMGVGGAVDMLAGQTRRASPIMQRLGLEWAVRVAQEPRRLWKRYLITNSAFVWLTVQGVARHRSRRRPVAATRSPASAVAARDRSTERAAR